MTAVFVDTNVLVYVRDDRDPDKRAGAGDWMAALWRDRSGRISYQVLQEYYAVVTGRLSPGLDAETARADVRRLLLWNPLPVGSEMIEGAWALQDRHGIAWWDALIVSAARLAGCGVLLTEDLQHGCRLGGVEVISPFQLAPGQLH